MGPLETLRLAMTALLRNKLRSFLTALGIIIGVGAVIAMVAIGEGAKQSVEDAFAALGTNLLIIMPGSSSSGGARGGFGSQPTLTYDDLKAVQTEMPLVARAAPVLNTNAQLQSEDQNWATRVTGTTPDYLEIRRWKVVRGETLSLSDIDSGAKVVLLGATVAEKLYGANADPVGQLVRIKSVPFQIIGVLDKKGQSSMGQDYDDTAIVPLSTFRARLSPSLGNFLTGVMFVSVRSAGETQAALTQLTALLRERHHLGVNADDDFSIRNLQEMASAQQQGADTLSLLLACIAGVSLVVGGIGIMNIMLVSVTERTREIGIRMAIGATPGQVLWQFLTEAMALAFVGGVIGAGGGVAVAKVLAANTGWVILIRPDVVAVSTGFAALVGIGFGLYPALKASRMDPINALRFE